MHLRKLVWCLPLLLATTAARAEQPGSFLEGAQLVSLTSTGANAPANSPPTAAGLTLARQPAPKTVAPVADGPEAAPTPEIRSLLVLVAALALVGWIQRRRRDA